MSASAISKLFIDMSGQTDLEGPDDVQLHVLVPAFMISELRRAFEIGGGGRGGLPALRALHHHRSGGRLDP